MDQIFKHTPMYRFLEFCLQEANDETESPGAEIQEDDEQCRVVSLDGDDLDDIIEEIFNDLSINE